MLNTGIMQIVDDVKTVTVILPPYPGCVLWHSSDPDSGMPDVGVEVRMGDGGSTWFGEISLDLYDSFSDEEKEIGGPGGWWIVEYDPCGDHAMAIGKCLPYPSEATMQFIEVFIESVITINQE